MLCGLYCACGALTVISLVLLFFYVNLDRDYRKLADKYCNLVDDMILETTIEVPVELNRGYKEFHETTD